MRSRVANGIRKRESTLDILRESLWSTEYLSLGILFLYTLLDIIFIREVRFSFGILQINVMIAVGIVAFAMWYDQTGNRVAYILRSFYILPVGYLMYAQVHNYIPLVNPVNYDSVLAAWDRALFNVNPTEWISQFSTPILTEYFQIWYNVFQLLLVVPALALFRRNRTSEFRIYAMTIMLGFYVSYLLYFVMPAIGPRFEVHDFYSISTELPGLWLTEPLRAFINAGNNIPMNMVDPYEFVNRDCMPSGHTMMSVLGILMVWRYRIKWRWLVTVGAVSIIISTVYLRYHYVVDLMAGTALALIVFYLHVPIANWWKKRNIQV